MDFPFLLFHFESILVFVCLFCFVFSLLPPWIFFLWLDVPGEF